MQEILYNGVFAFNSHNPYEVLRIIEQANELKDFDKSIIDLATDIASTVNFYYINDDKEVPLLSEILIKYGYLLGLQAAKTETATL